MRATQSGFETGNQLVIQSITLLGAVHRDAGDGAFDLIDDNRFSRHTQFSVFSFQFSVFVFQHQSKARLLDSISLISISIRSSAVEKVFPCASVISDRVPPPPRLSCKRKFSAPRFGSSNRSTSPWEMPVKCFLTRSAVTSRLNSG